MFASLAISAFAVQGNALVYALLAGAIAPLFLIRIIRPEFAWAVFVVMINLALAALALRFSGLAGSTIQLCAYYASGVALLWSLCAWGAGRSRVSAEATGYSLNRHCLLAVSQVAATTAALAATAVVVFILCIRGVYSVLEVWHGAPLYQNQAFQFGAGGLVIIAMLAMSCTVGLLARGDRRLIAALFWLSVMAVSWGAMLSPTYRPLTDGRFERTPAALILTAGLALTVCGFVACQASWNQRSRWRAAHIDPDRLLDGFTHWPGIRVSAGTVGLVLILLVCYQMADPASSQVIGTRWAPVATAVCAGSCGVALFSLLSSRWSANLADIAMSLVTLAAALLALVFVPTEPVELAARFPMNFNAIMAAFALAAFLWVWISNVWRQQLDRGCAWTAAGLLAPMAQRFAFFVACLALAVGGLMSIWPRLRAVANPDDSIGRVAAAVSAHLLLMLVLLWSGRTVRRSSFGALTILVAVSLVFFIVVRSGPLAPNTVRSVSEAAGQTVFIGERPA